MAPIWRQDISWSNDDKNLCWLDAALDVYELLYGKVMIEQDYDHQHFISIFRDVEGFLWGVFRGGGGA